GLPDISACDGDSGGPLVTLDGNELVEVGVVSWGPIDCGIAPGVYSRLSTLGTWVQSVVGTSAPPTPVPTPDVTRLAGADRAATLRAKGYNVVRYAGASRYETAVAVANALGEPATIVEATGTSFADALTGGAAAAHAQGVVLLTAGDQLPAATAAYLADHG